MDEPFPKLSEELTGPKHPARCQACGAEGKPLVEGGVSVDLERWRECDRFDWPTPVVVMLCKPCADRIIEPHARLYQQLERFAPYPGTELICEPCVHRDGTRCTQAQINGGPGVTLIHPKPTQVHLCRRGKGQRSGWTTLYRGPVKACDRREVQSQDAN